MLPITESEARTRGLAILAGPYGHDPREARMLTRAALQLGSIRHAVVAGQLGRELWRSKGGMVLQNGEEAHDR